LGLFPIAEASRSGSLKLLTRTSARAAAPNSTTHITAARQTDVIFMRTLQRTMFWRSAIRVRFLHGRSINCRERLGADKESREMVEIAARHPQIRAAPPQSRLV
jgi:hypothetical protein